jgi:hypothetical protein
LIRHLWLALLVPPLVFAQQRADRAAGSATPAGVLYLWSGEHVRRLSAGFEAVLADIYWLRTVQYYGSQRAFAKERRYDLLRPLIDITTTLDPRFEIAYRYGATFLAEPWPVGAGDVRGAEEVLTRGVRALPDSWRLRQQLALHVFTFRREPERAARVLMDAADLPGAPFWFRTLAADMLAQGGHRRVSREIWRRMYEQGEEGVIRQNALMHLRRLDAADEVDRLNQQVELFVRSTGRPPRSPRELEEHGLLRGLPLDPAGVPYDYDPSLGRFAVSRGSWLWSPS